MTPEQLRAIKNRLARASAGPWESGLVGIWNAAGYVVGHPEILEGRDRLFIAHAREDIPALVVRVEELEGLLRRAAKYAKEDRAVTPGFTRLERVLDEARRALNPQPTEEGGT